MTGYDAECRRSMAEWGFRVRHRYVEVYILVRHKRVAMGVATGALLVGAGLVEAHTAWGPSTPDSAS